MGLYLYCVVPATHSPASGLAGLDDREVQAQALGALAAWVTPLETRPEPTLERIQRHNDVVEAAVSETVTPIPIRFGQWLDGAEAVTGWLAERAEAYPALLEELSGCLEWGLRIVDPAAAPEAAPRAPVGAVSGREYLEALAEREAGRGALWQRGQALAQELGGELGDAVRRELVDPLPSAHGLVSIAHLVARRDFRRYRERVDAFRARHPDLRFLVSGPWPPYTFVE